MEHPHTHRYPGAFSVSRPRQWVLYLGLNKHDSANQSWKQEFKQQQTVLLWLQNRNQSAPECWMEQTHNPTPLPPEADGRIYLKRS